MDYSFSNKIFFRDEAHFTLGGYVVQNCRIWGSKNPKATKEGPLHPEKSLFGALFGYQDQAIRHHYTFLRGYAKDRVYADKPSTLEHLKTDIRQAMAEMPLNMCQKVVENYLKIRINACNTSRGVY